MKLGFIGCGIMGQAIMGGILKNGLIAPSEVIASDPSQEALGKAAEAYGIHTTQDNRKTAEADIIFLAVKPQYYETVIAEIRDLVTEGQIIVTIAPGQSISAVSGWFQKPVKIIRTMPNSPAMVGAGVTAVCASDMVTEEELGTVLKLFQSFGTTEVMPERLLNGVVGVTSSSPAYVFMIIEAMADGAVRAGFPRSQAYRLVAQAVLGSAKMVLDLGKHPGELKDMVCTPAGTTIEAIEVLEKAGLRGVILEGMDACFKKTQELN